MNTRTITERGQDKIQRVEYELKAKGYRQTMDTNEKRLQHHQYIKSTSGGPESGFGGEQICSFTFIPE